MSIGKQWRQVDDWRSACSLLCEWSLVAAVMWVAILLDTIPAYLVAILLMGALQHRLAALGHEAAHGTLFRNGVLNDAVADAACFFPILGTIHHYRRWHLAHHASPNDPERDPDVLNLGASLFRDQFPMSRGRLVWLVFCKGLSAPRSFVQYGWSYLLLNTFGVGTGLLLSLRHRRWYPAWAARLARLAFHVVLALALLLLGARAALAFLVLWIVPLLTTFPYLLMLRDTFQHTNADAGRYTNTRVFRVNAVLRWAVFPYGQDLHLPHHEAPAVPHYRLEALHHYLIDSVSEYGEAATECRGVLRNRTGEPTIADVLTQGT